MDHPSRSGIAKSAAWMAAVALLAAAAPLSAETAPSEPPLPVLDDPPEVTGLQGYRADLVPAPIFGGEAYVVEAGPADAQPLVLIHGIGSAASDWYGALPALAEHHRILTFDLPGFGRSSRSDEPYAPETYAAFVEALVRARVNGRFHLVGHSLGASIAIEVAARMPDSVDRLVLVDTAGILEPRALIKELSEAAIERKFGAGSSFGRFLREHLRGAIHDVPRWLDRMARSRLTDSNAPREDSSRRAASELMTHDFGAALDAIRAPTLIVWGEDDVVSPPRTAWTLSSRIADAQVELMPGVGHVPMREAKERFTEITLAWLSGDRGPQRALAGNSERVGRCRRGSQQLFEGEYAEIHIESCRDVTLRGVRAARIVIKGSEVAAEDLVVEGEGVALSVVGSELTVSGGHFSGDVALRSRGSDLDLSGVTLEGQRAAIETPRGTNLICSVCRLRSPQGSSRMHESRGLGSGTVL